VYGFISNKPMTQEVPVQEIRDRITHIGEWIAT